MEHFTAYSCLHIYEIACQTFCQVKMKETNVTMKIWKRGIFGCCDGFGKWDDGKARLEVYICMNDSGLGINV